jgi:Kae1-associated kinase Bud32
MGHTCVFVMDLLAKGAEANLYLADGKLVKHRISKGYRAPELDARLRRLRTAREAKLLDNALRAGISVPRVFRTEERENRIVMEYLDASPLKDVFETASDERISDLAGMIGASVSRMHDANIIHNDLTTSNMLFFSGRIYFIDFGLGSTSTRIEDKAMDLAVLKKSLKVAHNKIFHLIWEKILAAYKGNEQYKEVMARMQAIEKRARYSE